MDGYAQDGGVVWRHGGIDDWPGNDDASVLALEMDRWKTAAVASESALDRCVPHPATRLGRGLRL